MTTSPSNHHGGVSFERVLDALRDQGITPKATRGGAKSSCPLEGHKNGDRDPSLSIQYLAADGRTRVRCHMGDHTGREEEILAALGLTFADLYDEPKQRGPVRRSSSRSSGTSPKAPQPATPPSPAPAKKTSTRTTKGERSKVVAEYIYLDGDGSPLMKVMRFEPKTFRQQKHENGRWVWGAPAAEDRALYHLPEVLAAAQSGGVVHLCEGEKDADAVRGVLGENAAATTAPMGADKWLPVYTEQLHGAGRVVIWRDKDDSGTSQARTVAAALTAAGIEHTVVEAAEGKDAADHLAAGHRLEDAITVDPSLYTEAKDEAEPADNVVQIREPGEVRHHTPEHRIPMGRGTWAYELGGEGRLPRGVYTFVKDQGWEWVAPLPVIHARVVLRDGSDKRTGTAYLMSVEPDSKALMVDYDQVLSGAWASILGIPVSAANQIQQAAATAISYAAVAAPEREATPRTVDGRVSVPVVENMPPGYLQTSRYSPDEARSGWAQLIPLIAQSPKMALVVGASAVAPFVAASRAPSHIVHIYGNSGEGKTTTLHTAGSIWGTASFSAKDSQAQVVTDWNASGQGPAFFLGELGVFPAFFDEISEAPFHGPQDWGSFISRTCEGSQRKRPGRYGGLSLGKRWNGILISSGNGRMLEGLGSGRHAGVFRRVIELAVPLTSGPEHAQQIEKLWEVVYGHAGHALLETHSAQTVLPLIEQAKTALPTPSSPIGSNVAKHLRAHIAGAAMLDQWAGTGSTLRDAAITAALEYLETWAEPEHDADRMIAAVRDAMGREPAMWPTVSAYLEMKRPMPGFKDDDRGTALPRHGVDRSITGLHANDGQWVALFSNSWKSICSDLGLDSAVTCRELHARGVLQVPESKRRRGEWVTQIREAGTGMYKLVLPVEDDDLDEPSTPPATDQVDPGEPAPADLFDAAPEPDVVGQDPERCGSVVGEVVGQKPPLTCDVVGVVGVVGEPSHVGAREAESRDVPVMRSLSSPAPCVICATPARHTLGGDPIHLGECQRLWRDQHPDGTPSPASPAETPSAPRNRLTPAPAEQPQPRATGKQRWSAPAAVVDAQDIYLPAGLMERLPETVRHLGDLAALTGEDALAIGHGGDKDRLPDLGQIWLTASALTRLGLPATLPEDEKARGLALADLRRTPAVADALEDGWQIGSKGVREWTRIWHPERLPRGAFLVAHPWQRIDGVGLWADQPEPAELVDRLAAFATATGITYRITPATTGIDLIDHTRPPLRPGEEPNASRVALPKGVAADLPPFLQATRDKRYLNLEADFSWWRLHSSLGQEEKARRYVHAFDRNKSYLAPWSSIELGVGKVTHLVGEQARWDGKEHPGYYRITRPEWTHTHLPNPVGSLSAHLSDGTMWVTVHTLRQLAAHDIDVDVHEAWVWDERSRYLEPAAKRLRPLLTSGHNDPVTATLKGLYTSTVGKLGQIEHDPDFHLWRPDWRHHVIAHTRTAILHTLTQNAHRSGAFPLAVSRDLIVYASDEADPAAAWPGDPSKIGPGLGQWKHVGQADMATWAPRHLVRRVGAWHYKAAVDDLH